MIVPGGTTSSCCSTGVRTSRPRSTSRVCASGNVSPVDSGNSLRVGPSLTTIRNGSPSARSTPACGTVRTTWPTTGTRSLRSRVISRTQRLGATRFRASASGISTRSGTVYTGVRKSRVARMPSTTSAATTNTASMTFHGNPRRRAGGSLAVTGIAWVVTDAARSGSVGCPTASTGSPGAGTVVTVEGVVESAVPAALPDTSPTGVAAEAPPISESSGRITRSSPAVTSVGNSGSASTISGGSGTSGGRTTPPVGSSGDRRRSTGVSKRPVESNGKGSGRGSLDATCTSSLPNWAADERSSASGRPACSSTEASGPRSADTGISRPTRAARAATVESFLNGSVPVTASCNVRHRA